MTQATKEQQVRKGQPVTGGAAIDRSDKPGSIGLLLLVAGVIVGAAIALGFLANEWAQPLILAFLALLVGDRGVLPVRAVDRADPVLRALGPQ
jgi:hypothetical protein